MTIDACESLNDILRLYRYIIMRKSQTCLNQYCNKFQEFIVFCPHYYSERILIMVIYMNDFLFV